MGDVSYQPEFHHLNWVDRVDQIFAEGSNGFNVRFRAISADLRKLPPVVTRIGVALDAASARAAPPTGLQQLVITPVLRPMVRRDAWTYNPRGDAVTVHDADGVLNLNLPDQARLTSFGVRAEIRDVKIGKSNANFGAKLCRAPIRAGAQTADVLAGSARALTQIPEPGVSLDFQEPVNPAFERVDLSGFRYFIEAVVGDSFPGGLGSPIVSIYSFHISYFAT